MYLSMYMINDAYFSEFNFKPRCFRQHKILHSFKFYFNKVLLLNFLGKNLILCSVLMYGENTTPK